MFLKMCIFWIFLSFYCNASLDAFRCLPAHDKFIYVIVTCLVPISIPSQSRKNTKILYMMSVIFSFLECLFILLYALLIRHFYHFNPYKDFYVNELPEKLAIENFDILILTLSLILNNICSPTFKRVRYFMSPDIHLSGLALCANLITCITHTQMNFIACF